MIHHREAFLNHLANRLGRKRRKEVQRPIWTVDPRKKQKSFTKEDLINHLEEQCQNIHTQFKRTTKDRLNPMLEEVLHEYEARSVLMPKDQRFTKYGVSLEQGVDDVHIWDGENPNTHLNFAESADVSIVFSDLTLAESGTVTLFHQKSHGRVLTVLPQTFIALIPVSSLVWRMTDAAKIIRKRQRKENFMPSCISFISGPSNSADIEMNLLVGVHGPVAATYIVIDS